MNKDLINIWNRDSARIPEDIDPSPYAVDKEKLFPRDSTICDLGGGSGANGAYFQEKGHRVILADISDLALAKASARGLKTKQIDMSEGKLPFRDGQFDVVFSHLSLHYFDAQTTTKLLSEIFRMLKYGGQAFIAVKSPNDTEEMAFLKSKAKEIKEDVFTDHGKIQTRFAPERYENFIKKAGIKDFEIAEYCESFQGNKNNIASGNQDLVLIDICFRKS